MAEYHKIETLYERDDKTFKLKPELILKGITYLSPLEGENARG